MGAQVMRTAASCARMSDPDFNMQFRRRWTETPRASLSRGKPEPIRLIEIPSPAGGDGVARAALLVPPLPSALDRRPVRRVFNSIGEAIAAKRVLEAAR